MAASRPLPKAGFLFDEACNNSRAALCGHLQFAREHAKIALNCALKKLT